MSLPATISRGFRLGTEATLEGIETLAAANVQPINAIIPAASADVLAICRIDRAQVQAIGLLTDYPVTVRFVGSRSVTVTASNVVGGYGTSNFVLDEPLPDWIGWDDVFAVADTDAEACSFWTVYDYSADRLTVYPHGNLVGGATEGELGVLVPISNRQFPIAWTDVAPQLIVVDGEFDGEVGDIAYVYHRGVTEGGVFSVLGSVYDPATNQTTITTYDWGLGALPAGGFLRAMSFEYRINLAAGVPFLWSIDSGLECPLICDVTELRVTNDDPTNEADLRGRIITAV